MPVVSVKGAESEGLTSMNQGIVFALATTVLVATVAVAHVAAPLPDGTQRGSAKAATGAVQPAPASSAQLPSAKPALVETRQAPVPPPAAAQSPALRAALLRRLPQASSGGA